MENKDTQENRSSTASKILSNLGGISEHSRGMLADHILTVVREYQSEKSIIQQELDNCRLQSRSEYSDTELSNYSKTGIGCTDYQPLTESKINVAQAMLFDIIYQAGERAWMIEPTPEPDLPEEIYKEISNKSMELFQQWQAEGAQVHESDMYQLGNDMRHELSILLDEEARQRADNMQKKMDDQLAEGGFWKAIEKVSRDFCTYPACFMRTATRKERVARFIKGKFEEEDKDILQWERVSPFHVYPSRNNKDLDRDSLFMKVSYSRAELYSLRTTPGYDEKKIEEALSEYGPSGLVEKDPSVSDNVEIDRYEDSDKENTGTISSGVIEGFEYWGNVPGKMLKEWGMTEQLEDLAEYAIHSILIGNYIVFAELNTNALNRKLFYTSSYEDDLDSVWGGSLPRKIRSSQKGLNSARRSLITNMALMSGPQVIVNKNAIEPGDDPSEIYPLKIWYYDGADDMGGSKKPVEFYQPNANLDQIMPVIEKFMKEADDFSGLPRYSQGDSAGAKDGAAGTATGLSMLMNAQSKTFKKVIANFDNGIIKKSLEDLYYKNLADPEINDDTKGDMRIVTRGVLGMSLQEQVQLRRHEFLQMVLGSEILMNIIKPDGLVKLLREVVKTLDMPAELLKPSDSKLEQMEKQAEQNNVLKEAVQIIQSSAQSGIISPEQYQTIVQMISSGGQGMMPGSGQPAQPMGDPQNV